MKNTFSSAAAVLIIAAVALPAGSAWSATFASWRVEGVPSGDVLNVRKYPASHSQKQGAYPNGTVLQMTGKCTGSVDLFEIGNLPAWKQRQIVRFRWCQIWHDPARDGKFVTGWVYGRYVAPY